MDRLHDYEKPEPNCPDISVVIPLYNEEESLPELFSWIQRVMKEHDYTYEVIFVNDGSTDRSWDVIEELAQKANMAPTTFHRHFRKVTSVSPIQYQKKLRLHEGRRLIISGDENVAEAAYTVGYESPTQFSREYKRLFGVSPRADAAD